MPLLDFIKKPKQINPISDNRSFFPSYGEHKNGSFLPVPLSPPSHKPSYYNKNASTDVDTERNNTDRLSYPKKPTSTYEKNERRWGTICCCCFPCFPLWGRTLCCFLFLVIVILLVFLVLIVFTFKAPQVKILDSNYNLQNEMYSVNYSLYNSNFFGFNFENVKFMAYYSGTIETWGTGEVQKLELHAQSMVNITIPMQIMIHGQRVSDTNSSIFLDRCGALENKDQYQKTVEISIDVMPTFKIMDYPIATIVFHGQKTKTTCSEILKTKTDIDLS
ncbi:hypothetical protein BY458DRAFT_295609 [Sporodiniella umbellata]|nr:hypothetical protein BY458DRAFT_295609 [Sporodiniella umbellata]